VRGRPQRRRAAEEFRGTKTMSIELLFNGGAKVTAALWPLRCWPLKGQ
jgi:hypothetical protein